MQFILRELGQEPLSWMKQLPFDLQITTDIYACHGTPRDDLVYLLEDISAGKPIVRADYEIIERLNGVITTGARVERLESKKNGNFVITT